MAEEEVGETQGRRARRWWKKRATGAVAVLFLVYATLDIVRFTADQSTEEGRLANTTVRAVLELSRTAAVGSTLRDRSRLTPGASVTFGRLLPSCAWMR